TKTYPRPILRFGAIFTVSPIYHRVASVTYLLEQAKKIFVTQATSFLMATDSGIGNPQRYILLVTY
ncbi:MAG: hypothetical protein MGU50_05400, partial [Trichodesmium sp. MAG_R02]|nr:hypothetical protein [Trichodesmium sp. MAG_R02]